MNPIKKFSTEINQPKSILESIDSNALLELIKGMGFNNIHELKKEKNLLIKLEALVKEVTMKQDISEDRAKEIEDELNAKGSTKSMKLTIKEAIAKKLEEDAAKEIEDAINKKGEPKKLKLDGISDEAAKKLEEDAAKEIEDTINKKGEPKKLKLDGISDEAAKKLEEDAAKEIEDTINKKGEPKKLKTTLHKDTIEPRKIMTFENFVQGGLTNKSINIEESTIHEGNTVTSTLDDKENAKEFVAEGEVLVFDKLGSHLDELRQEIYNIIQATDDNNWIRALQSIGNDLSKLERSIDKYDSKLGVIPTNEGKVTEGNTVTFTLDDGDLDDKFLSDKSLSRNLDYKEYRGDSYYVLPKRDFDRLQDWADSSGYDIDEVIDVIEESKVDEFGPLAGSGNTDELENTKRKASKKSERGQMVYVIGGKYGTYKLSKYEEEGNTYAAYINGTQQELDESVVSEANTIVNEAKELDAGLAQITVNHLIKTKSEFKEEIWMSAFDRDNIKSEYGAKLPRGFASNNTSMMVGAILRPLGYNAYIDGDSLVVGDKTVLKLKGTETWEDIAKVINVKESVVIEETKVNEFGQLAGSDAAEQNVITEGKDDYIARFDTTTINLKKGYRHLKDAELKKMYDKLGTLIKGLPVKDITIIFESNKLERADESIVNEADIKSDDNFKEYAFAVLTKAFGDDFDEAKAQEVVDGLTTKYSGDYGAMVGALQSSLGESATAESKVINKTTGKDITKHLLDYMEKKITKEEFEKLTGLTKESVVNEEYDFTMSDAADIGGTDSKTETKVFAKYLKYIGAKDASQAYLIDAEDAEDFEETGKAETVKGSGMYGNNKDESLVTLGTIKGIKAIKISDGQDLFYYVNAQGAKKLF